MNGNNMDVSEANVSEANVSVSEANVSVSEANVSVSEANVSVSVSNDISNTETDSETETESDVNETEVLLQTCREQIDELQKFVDEMIISDEEKMQLYETAYNLVCETIQSEPMLYIQPHFHDIVSDQVSELLRQQLVDIFINIDYISDIIQTSVEVGLQLFYKKNAPMRSHKYTIATINDKKDHDDNITNKIDYLKSVPQPEQRTPEWYAFRQNVLTASNIWKVFSTPNTNSQLIYEKCLPQDEDKFNNQYTNTSSPMHWGQRFEPVSVMYYENKYNTKIGDFGCIPHKSIKCLAASPDGINVMKESGRYGRMLEVKNIVNRVIDGVPKMEYWIQMQVQMEVCDLDECDFLETRFVEYECEDDFNVDFSVSSFHKGLIMYFNNNGKSLYEYSKWGAKRDEIEMWENDMMEKHKDLLLVQNIYWKLEEISCVLVLRNKLWFDAAKPMIENTWDTIVREKENGEYVKREPKKRMAKNASSSASASAPSMSAFVVSKPISKCLINTSLFDICEDAPNVTVYDISGVEVDTEPDIYDDCDM